MRDKDRANKNEIEIFVFGENYGAVGSRCLIGGSLRRLPAIVRDDAPRHPHRRILVNARASRQPSLRLGCWYPHCAKHRYSIGTKME